MTAASIALLAALRVKAGAGFAIRAEVAPWCGVDQAGERHLLTLAFRDRASAERLLADLDDHEFALPGDFVADIRACAYADETSGGVEVTVEALTFPAD